jgi:hypothetical protein
VEEEREMNSKKIHFKPALLLVLAVMLFAYACTQVEDNSHSGSLLLIDTVTGIPGGPGEQDGAPLLSDTCDSPATDPQDPEFCTVFNDNAEITFSNQSLQVGPGSGQGTSFLNDVIVNRYRVDYFRANNRNTPGVDVPFGIDGTMNIRVPIDSSATGSILVVRHTAKREPPLAELDNGSSEGVITVNAQIRTFGADISGHNVSATGFLEIHFANYGETQ